VKSARWIAINLVFLFAFVGLSPSVLPSSFVSIDSAMTGPLYGPGPLDVSFSAVASITSEMFCTPESYDWDFGDGSSGSGALTSHTYTEAGTFLATVSYTYEISFGQSEACTPMDGGTASVIVDVEAICTNEGDQILAAGGTRVEVGTVLTFFSRFIDPITCSASTEVSWVLLSKPDGSSAILVPTVGVTTSLIPDLPGTYIIGLNAPVPEVAEVPSSISSESYSSKLEPLGFELVDTLTITATTEAGESSPPEVLSVSPTCIAPGEPFSIIGLGLVQLSGTPVEVLVNNVQAPILAHTLSGIVARMPSGITGQPTVRISGVAGTLLIDVAVECGFRTLTDADLAAGFVVGDVIIFFNGPQNQTELNIIKSEFGFSQLFEYPTLGFYMGKLASPSFDLTLRTIILLNNDVRVDRAFYNYLNDTSQSSDPEIGNQDWLAALGLPLGWEFFFPNQGSGITIGVIDTGADLNLPQPGSPELALDSGAPDGLNYAPETSDDTGEDDIGHGTIVSTIAAGTGNGFNGSGVAPNATVIPFKVFAEVGGEIKGTNEGIAEALGAAFSLGVDVINMSLGCFRCDATTEQEMRDFYQRVIDNLLASQRNSGRRIPVIVASSGNDGESTVDSPAAHPDVIAVGSVRPNLTARSSFSNFGPELDFMALGEGNETTILGGSFGDAGRGTSFSAPQVAGLVALILAENRGISPDAVKELIIECFSVDIGASGFDEQTGWGRIAIPNPAEAPLSCL
jgi:hypothetical protein